MWTVIRNGSEVLVCDHKGHTIAAVGSKEDFRLSAKLNNANIIAAAPEMLEVLIDMNELIRREYFIEEHPLLQLVNAKCNKIIESCMKVRKEHEKESLYSRSNRTTEQRYSGSNSGGITQLEVEPYEDEIVEQSGGGFICTPLEEIKST